MPGGENPHSVKERADAVPELTIVLNPIDTPECTGVYAGREAERREEWGRELPEEDKDRLFRRSAAETYRIALD